MKVTRNIPEHLIIENAPAAMSILVIIFVLTFVGISLAFVSTDPLFGGMFVFAGLFIGVIFSIVFMPHVQLILYRPKNLIALRNRSVFGYSVKSWPLDTLQSAILQSTKSSRTRRGKNRRRRSSRNLHRAVMVFSNGTDSTEQPVTQAYSSGPSAKRTADAINQWLERAKALDG